MKKKTITASLVHRAGRPFWYIVISYYDEDTGKRKQIWESTKIPYPGNKREAQTFMRGRLEALNKNTGRSINPSMEVNELAEKWLENVRTRVRANTYERYALNTAKIIEYFQKNRIKVVDFNRSDAKMFFNYLMKKGKKNKKTGKREPMSSTTVRDIKVVLKMIFDEALDANIINYNPVEKIKISTSSFISETKKMKYMDRETAKNFINFCKEKEDILSDLMVAAISFGLRRSELLALRYSDICLAERYIRISSTITKTATIHYENNTKNISSARIIPITDAEAKFFSNILAKKNEYKKLFGNTYHDNDFVFTWQDGHPFSPDYISQHSKKLLIEFGEPDLHFHSFRHTYASIQLENGVNLLELQRLMGHAPGSDVTLDIYSHINRKKAEAHPTGFIK